MKSANKIFSILSLFDKEAPIWHAEDIIKSIECTRATGYRYLKELVDARFLQKVAGGCYMLGIRIIELDYKLTQSDPLLRAAIPVLGQMADRLKLNVVLTSSYGMSVIDTYRIGARPELERGIGRGVPRSLFLGASAKIILSQSNRRHLKKIYDTHQSEIDSVGLGSTWEEFRTRIAKIRRNGFYFSIGEFHPDVGAGAVPLGAVYIESATALALVGEREQMEKLGPQFIKQQLDAAKLAIERELPTFGGPGSEVQHPE